MVNEIIKNKTFIECLAKIAEIEKDRKFCRHDMVHFLDVARIAYIMTFEEGVSISKDKVYATGLLHDIGRHKQYVNNIPHEVASADIAAGILRDIGCPEDEIEDIKEAILNHRNPDVSIEKNLKGYIYRADKSSRKCFTCDARDECRWSDDKKNMVIKL